MTRQKISRTVNAQTRQSPSAAIFFFLIIVMTGALVLVWKALPTPPRAIAPQPPRAEQPLVKTDAGLTQAACEQGGGKWTDCASPCLGKKDVACAQVCVPQCLCGGKSAWSCPKDFFCSATSTDGIGACTNEPTTDENLGYPVRERPEGMVCDPRNALCVSSSYVNSVLGNPWYVTSSLAEHEVLGLEWELFDGNGKSLGSVSGGPGMALTDFQPNMPSATTGTLRLSAGLPNSDRTAKGLLWTALDLPIRFPEKTRKMKIYLADLMHESCGIYPMTVTIPETSKPIEAALKIILWEATYNPNQLGAAFTSVPQNVGLHSIVLSNGVLRVDFSKELDGLRGDSCGVGAFRKQVEQTVKQFGNVQKVEIMVEGVPF